MTKLQWLMTEEMDRVFRVMNYQAFRVEVERWHESVLKVMSGSDVLVSDEEWASMIDPSFRKMAVLAFAHGFRIALDSPVRDVDCSGLDLAMQLSSSRLGIDDAVGKR